MNAIVAPGKRVLCVDGALSAAASQHFRRLFALPGCAMGPPAATGKRNVGQVVQQRHLITFSAVIGTLKKIPRSWFSYIVVS